MKIAVIGGGFSGLLAAYLLEKEGLEVTVYEKEHHLGGHCYTLTGQGIDVELGTLFSFSGAIKELLIELQLDYKERFVYRHFLDENYVHTEHMSREDVAILTQELTHLNKILEPYKDYLNQPSYGTIPHELLMPLQEFFKLHHLKHIAHIIAPHLSAFGFGSIHTLQAYYVFKVFNQETLFHFMHGDKLLFISGGISRLIHKLSANLSDIRLGMEVTSICPIGTQVQVSTPYSDQLYDKVLLTTPLEPSVLKDTTYQSMMENITTHPFVVSVYEVMNKNLTTTYYKHHLGKSGKVQFFSVTKHQYKTLVTAYAYGRLTPTLIETMTKDLKQSGIQIKRLITTKQWHIFPHLKTPHLTQNFYSHINTMLDRNPIGFIGSLVCEPSIDQLYLSIRQTVNQLVTTLNKG